MDDVEDALSVRFTRHLQIEPADAELREIMQQACIINFGATDGIAIASGAHMNADSEALFRSKTA